ncbi:BamA/TamA family outer membrane protein [Crinalium epipsammum]|nr:BamA/TamA family outer membrane protein [Crinalium epipsammum]
MRLSPLLLAAIAATTTMSLSSPANGQTPNPAGNPSGKPGSGNVIIDAAPVSGEATPGSNQPKPTTPLGEPVRPQEPLITPPGTESTPRQETPNRVEFNITPGAPSLEINPPTTNPTQPTTPTLPTIPTPAPIPQQEARVLVAEVQVRGVSGQLQDEVYKVIRTKPGRATTRSQLQEDLNAIYATGYFANVEFVPEDTPLGVRVAFVVQPNPVLQTVNVTTVPPSPGSGVVPASVVNSIFSPQYGRILNLKELQESIKKLNQWYKDNGYDLAQVIDVPQPTADGKVNLVVAEGVIEDIQVRFLDKEGSQVNEQGTPLKGRTRPFIVTREVQLTPGDVFNRKLAERDLRRVYGLGIFDDVRLSFNPGQDPRKVVVVVNVIEKNTGSVAAGAGISSASGFFGTVSYQQQNLGGNNQKLGTELQLGQRELLFDVNFTNPWIAGDPYRTSYTVNAFRRRSISLIFDGGEENEITLGPEHDNDRPRVVRLGGGVNFSRPLIKNPFDTSPWRASLGLQYQRVSIRDADGDLAPRDELGNNLSFSGSGRDDLLLLQLGAVRDRRNNSLIPTQGDFLRFGVEQSVPLGEGNILLNRLRGSYSYYIPASLTKFGQGPQAFAFNIQAGTVLGDLPPYEAFSLGGSNSVRGYDEGDIGSGRSFIQGTAEYRFPLFSVVGAALFADYATDLGSGNTVPGNPAGVRGKPGNGLGYGLGVRINSPLGPIRIDYGFNDEGKGRLHFGIGERF